MLAELERVLKRKLGFSAKAWRETRAFLNDIATAKPPAAPSIEQATGDPADDVILATAIAANVDVLVSGDTRHLLPLGTHQGVRILRPQELLAELS